MPASPISQQFQSLAGAMVQFYAAESGMSLEAFLGTNSVQVASLVGLPELAPSLSSVGSLDQFQLRLRGAGATLEVAGMTSFEELAAEFNSKASSMDGQVALLGASYASQLGSMYIPELTMPAMGNAMSGSPETLAFGLFVNKSITNLVSNHPDVFAQVRQTGLGTPAAMSAWRQSMLQAGTTVGSDLSRLPMPCIGEMLQGMATGSVTPSGSGCGACAVAGTYLHQQASTLLDPNTNTTFGANGSGSAPMQPWLADALTSQNPGLAAQLDQVLAPTNVLGSCSAASSATSSAVSALLPGVFANLRPSGTTPPALPGGFGTLQPSAGSPTRPPTSSTPLPSSAPPALPGGFDSLTPRRDR
jgi:hypothetical protein